MEAFNHTLFLLLNAPAVPGPVVLGMARFFAECINWLVPLAMIIVWLRGDEQTRRVMIQAALAGGLGLLINQLVGTVWHSPRPFMIALGHTHAVHAPTFSFPSNHLTMIWAVALLLMLHRRFRLIGGILALLGIAVAWARIYLGIHFPLDMLGALAVAALSACMVCRP